MASLFQFSIRGLLVAVTFLAVGIAALLNANGVWQGVLWGLALYALAASILLVMYRRDEKRAFWLGFSIFGWMYLLLLLISQSLTVSQAWIRLDPLKYKELLATRLAHLAHENVLPESRRLEYITVQIQQPSDPAGNPGGPPGSAMMPGMPGGGDMSGGGMMGGGMSPMMGSGGGSWSVGQTPNPSYVPLETFTQIFHALCLLLTAAVGGKTCQVIYRTRPVTEE